jgi:hypothetical protein
MTAPVWTQPAGGFLGGQKNKIPGNLLTGFESAWGSTLGAVNLAGNGTVSPYVSYSYGTADRLSGIASGGMTGSIVRTSTTEAFQVTPQFNNFSQDYAYNRILRSSTTGQPSNHLAFISGVGNLRNSNLTWNVSVTPATSSQRIA